MKDSNSRRNFIKGMTLATGILFVPEISVCKHKKSVEGSEKRSIRRADEKSIHLAYFNAAAGAVPNPGMGINGYAFSDHMHFGRSEKEWNLSEGVNPMKLSRETLDEMLKLPYVDNIYIRVEWRDIQKQQGRLQLPDVWNWVLEVAEKQGKRWSFRIMNCSPHSLSENGLPDFLQGRFKMKPYWHHDNVPGPRPKYFPEYSDEYLKWWGETVFLLGEKFDNHSFLEYVDVSGYGFWGEMHHWARYSPNGPVMNYQPATPDRIEEVIDHLVRDHLAAFPKTPAVLGLHAADYMAGQKAFIDGSCWSRRDSFQTNFSTTEITMAQGLVPGNAMIWETIILGIDCPSDLNETPSSQIFQIPQRYFDINCHYAAMGFNPWDVIWAHKHCLPTYEEITRHIGYRIRLSIVWRRKIKDQPDEIVMGLINDGCSAPPGLLSIDAKFPDGATKIMALPKGEPVPGPMKLYSIEIPESTLQKKCLEEPIELSLLIQIKGKKSPVKWAVKVCGTLDTYTLKVPLLDI